MVFSNTEDYVIGTDAINHSIIIWDSQTGEIMRKMKGELLWFVAWSLEIAYWNRLIKYTVQASTIHRFIKLHPVHLIQVLWALAMTVELVIGILLVNFLSQ